MGEVIKSNPENTNTKIDLGINMKNDPSKITLSEKDLIAQNEEDA